MRPWSIPCLLALGVASVPRTARAEPAPTDAQLVAARETFAAAEKDEDVEQWAEALVKLRRVAAVRLTPGVRYHIALCEEHVGQIAEAQADYTEAERQARSEGARDVLKLVGARIADVGARVPHVAIRIVPAIDGVVVTVDGAPCTDPSCAVDPGPHRIEAHAPERVPASTMVTVRERETAAVDLVLAAITPETPSPEPTAPAVVPAAATRSGRPPAATFIASAGALVLAAAGIGAFVAAGGALADGVRTCRQLVTLATGACDAEKNTVRAWDWAAAAAWTGAAGAGTLAVLSWTGAIGDSRPGQSASVIVSPRGVGVSGTF